MALNLRQAIAGLRSQLAQVEAAIEDFERLRRVDEEFRRDRALRRVAGTAGDAASGSASRAAGSSRDRGENSTEVSSVIWR